MHDVTDGADGPCTAGSPFFFTPEGFVSQLHAMRPEGVHVECEDALLEERINAGGRERIVLGQIKAQIGYLADKAELACLVRCSRHTVSPNAIVKRGIVQVGNIAV